MSLSPELQLLHENEATYAADPKQVGLYLANKTLVMTAGPTKIGKTSAQARVHELLPYSAAVPSETDRPRKDGDPVDYRTASDGVTTHGLIEAIAQRTLVNYAVHPAGFIYSTRRDDYSSVYNYLPTMATEVGIEQLRRAGFGRTAVAYILTSGNEYRDIVDDDDFFGKRTVRIGEAVSSLTYAKDHADEIDFIYNRFQPGGIETTASELARVGLGYKTSLDTHQAIDMIDELIAAAKDLAK